LSVDTRTTLLDDLREHIGLTGAKRGRQERLRRLPSCRSSLQPNNCARPRTSLAAGCSIAPSHFVLIVRKLRKSIAGSGATLRHLRHSRRRAHARSCRIGAWI
jgi:hypothetical protein